MNEPSNADIMEKLGGLIAEARHSSESRRVLHEKVDRAAELHLEQATLLVKVEAKLDGTTNVAAQARDLAEAALQNIHRFEQEFREVQLPIISAAQSFRIEAEPILGTMKVVRNIVVALLASGVLTMASVVAAFFWARDHLAALFRFLLGV